MSSLTEIEKRYLEKILGMGSGYVLDFTDATFGEFFTRHGVEIHGGVYQKYGASKAKKLRAFWEIAADKQVGHILNELLDAYEADCDISAQPIDKPILDKARQAANRLSGKQDSAANSVTPTEFLHQEFAIPNLQNLPIESAVVSIVQSRVDEARAALAAKAHLSVIFLCGSILEAVLLGAANREPARFNRASGSPKNSDGSTKRFHDWSLAQMIDVASELGILKPDIKKFSHGLRDFRNYIHPYEQMVSGFTPDEHTAKVCFQVLKGALASVAGER